MVPLAGAAVKFHAPFACPDFTVRWPEPTGKAPRLVQGAAVTELREVLGPLKLSAGTWCRTDGQLTVCFALPKGESTLTLTV